MDKPVHLSNDEYMILDAVAAYALKRLGGPPLSSVAPSLFRADLIKMASPLGIVPWGYKISQADLVFLAPYIDEWIAGKAPPRNLPAEYHDDRPERLQAFKERMRREGFWPQTDDGKMPT